MCDFCMASKSCIAQVLYTAQPVVQSNAVHIHSELLIESCVDHCACSMQVSLIDH